MKRSTTASKGRAAASGRDLDAMLRSRGLRRTMARVTVLRHMQGTARPMSHGDIAQALEAHGLDRATVYRNLIDLAEAGILVRTDLGDHVWRFELARSGDDETRHPHFICTDCGAVMCLPEDSVRLVATRKTPRAIGHKRVVVQVKGVCDECA